MAACGSCNTGKCPLNYCIDEIQHLSNNYLIMTKKNKCPANTKIIVKIQFNKFILECDCMLSTFSYTPKKAPIDSSNLQTENNKSFNIYKYLDIAYAKYCKHTHGNNN